MRFTTSLATLALAAGAAAPAAAQDQDTRNDVRCAILSAGMAASSDPAIRGPGTMALLYYVGKLDGRTPGLDLEARFREEIGKMTGDQFEVERARCSEEMLARGKTLQELGSALQAAPAAAAPQQH